MSTVIEALKQYLTRKEDLDVPAGNQPFVTLTRLDGVTSHELARAVIARLDDLPDKGWNHGWELIDQQLCAWLVRRGKAPATLESLLAERYGEGKIRQMFYEMLVGEAEQHELCRKVGDVTRFLLKIGGVVVVGSAAAPEAVGLKGPGLRVRLVASEATRVARMVAAENLTPEAAGKQIREMDATRTRMMREYYRRELDDPSLYDVTFYADRLSTKEMARAIVELLRARMETHARPQELSATQVISMA